MTNIPLYDLFYDLNVTGELDFSITSEKRNFPLRISFDIVRKAEKFVNQSTVSIYNLSVDNMLKIQRATALNVKLTAGYKNTQGQVTGLILDAPVQYSRVIREQTDYILTMVVADGFQQNEQVKSEKFLRGQTLSNIFQSLGAEIEGNLVVSPDVVGSLERNIYLTGTPRNIIAKLAENFGFKSIWENQTLYIYAKDIPVKNQLVEINYQSGMINYPSVVRAGVVKIQTILNPKIPFLGNVLVDSTEPLFINVESYNQDYAWLRAMSDLGTLSVIMLRHQGDSRQEGVGSWMTEIEGVKVA